ncbi:LysR substrate-binding domain-containing protein [uncultured Hoeflea sp.]|uniref:LysR substrate-binding domain-containing protein n=1 Tax=uncultured Hoeflea sp. TaxID=538666 RepID=UPI0030DD28A7
MKRSLLPLTALRAFEATMRHGQMKRAADELGVTYGAVSRQVRGLEESLGVALFEGPRNRLMPTQAALEMQPALQEAFDKMEAAVSRVMHRDRRTLDVSCLSTLAMRWLIPHLFDFQERHPKIKVRMTADDSPVDFARQSLDVAVRIGTGPWGPAQSTDLFPDEVGPVLSPKLLNSLEAAGWKQLSDLPTLHTRTRPAAWRDWCQQQGVAMPAGGQEFEHFYFMLEAATAGLGVGIAPEILVRADIRAGRLIAPFGFHPSGQTYVALTPAYADPDAVLFTQWLKDMALRPS